MRIDGPFDFVTKTIPGLSKELAVRYARVPGVHILVRKDRCVGCGQCVKRSFCRVGAISIRDRNVTIDDRRCRGCGRCTHLCPKNALALELRPPRLVTDTLKRIDDEVSTILNP